MRGSLLNSLFIGLIGLYILAGCRLVPLHGDEPTVIYTSLDFDALRRGDFARLVYRDVPDSSDPQAATKQDLRLINGMIARYTFGALWTAAGMTPAQINDQWLWGADMAFNRTNGHVPTADLLLLCRVGSGLFLWIAAALVFTVGRRAGGIYTAYLSALIFTLTPAVLLNGRRAMMEGALLCGIALVVYAGQCVAAARSTRAALRSGIGLGVAAGLCIAAKHTGAVTVTAVGFAISVYMLFRERLRAVRRLLIVGTVAFAAAAFVFFALNPAWWVEPLQMPGHVLAARSALLVAQTRDSGGYASIGERALGFFREFAAAPPQYYEIGIWSEWIDADIARYEASGLAGISGVLASALVSALVVVGAVRGVQAWRSGAVFVLLVTFALTTAAIFVTTPLHWQRYYLPLAAPVAWLAGLAVRRRAV